MNTTMPGRPVTKGGRLNIRIRPELKARMDAQAKAKGVTATALWEFAAEKLLAQAAGS